MSNHSTVRPGNPVSGNRRRGSRAVIRRAGVLAAAAAMVAAAFVVASPAGASVTESPRVDVQAVGAVSPIAGWTDTGSMITPRAHHAATRLADGRVLIAGGSGSAGALFSTEVYDPTTGTWQAAADMPVAIGGAAAVTLADGIVLFASGTFRVTELYNPATDTWTAGPEMPAIGGGGTFAATLPNGHVFVLGSTSAADYNPSSQTWTALATPPTMRGGTTAASDTTLLPNGDVLTLRAMLYTGAMPASPASGPGVYHWATNTWTVLPRPQQNPGDSGVSVAALPNGNVMLAGGTLRNLWFPSSVTKVMEVNPTTGKWTMDADLPQFSSQFVALPNGSILAAGGNTGADIDTVYSPTARN